MDVFLVENSPLIVARLCEMLGALRGVAILGHASTAREAIHEILKWRPQVALVDLELDEGSGFDVLRAVATNAPEVDIYMLTNYVSPPTRTMALKMGAKGFYDKSRDYEAVRDLIAGQAAQTRRGTVR